MAAFLITPEDTLKIREASRLAISRPLMLEDVKRIAGMATEEDGVISGDRPADLPVPQVVDLPLGWRLNISCEEQPTGLYLHLSMSTPTPAKTLPREEALQMVLDALKLGNPVLAWIEKFKDDFGVVGKAVNMLVPVQALG